MRRIPPSPPTVLILSAGYAQAPPAQPPLWWGKPDAAAFEKTENSHLATAKRAIDRMLAVKSARTNENTLVPFDEANRELDSPQYFSSLMEAVHPETPFPAPPSAFTP